MSTLKVGIIGCGAIGSGIVRKVMEEPSKSMMVVAIHDKVTSRAISLAKEYKFPRAVKSSIRKVFQSSDLIVEAVSPQAATAVHKEALRLKKPVIALSVGQAWRCKEVRNHPDFTRYIYIPSGAIAGLDAIRAAARAGITSATLTTTKPAKGLEGNSYLKKQGINLSRLKAKRLLFEGFVSEAVSKFPQNINVAATLSLALGPKVPLKIKIFVHPKQKTNIHEIMIKGASGVIKTRVENVPSPTNPKTSYLAVLSAVQKLWHCAESRKTQTFKRG